jgi:hypothetical protein
MKKNGTLKWKIEFDDVKHDVDMEKELSVDTGNLIGAFKEQPVRYAFFATLHEFARSYANLLKRELNSMNAALDAEFREEWPFDSKMTETAIRNAIITDERYVDAEEAYAEAEKQVKLLSVAREAFIQRKDMLIQLGPSVREELKTEEY